MASEHNDNIKTTQPIHEDVTSSNSPQNINDEGGNYNASNLIERKHQAFAGATTEENLNSQERTHRKSRTVSFSEDTRDLKSSEIAKMDVKAKSSDENNLTVNVEYDDSNVPYDRGWAWVIDFSCFLLFFVYLSHDHWHSVLLMDYMQEFNIPITVVTIMLSLGSICYCAATQISSNVLVIRFSIRIVATCAAILNVAATLLFAGVPNIAVFFIVNFIKYIVKGVTLIATLTLVGYYFRRRRGLATTLGLLGVGTSAMCAPPLIRYLRDEYGFRGCFLIMAGLEMHAILAALLLRPISTYRCKKIVPKHSNPEKDQINLLTAVNYADKKTYHQTSIQPTSSLSQKQPNHEKDESNSLTALNVAESSSSSQHISVAELLEQIPSPPTRITEISIEETDEMGSNLADEVSIPLIRENMNTLNNNSVYLDTTSGSKENNSNSYIGTGKAMVNENSKTVSDIIMQNGYNEEDVNPNDESNTTNHNDKQEHDASIHNIKIGSIPWGTIELAEETSDPTKVSNEDIVINDGGQLNGKISEPEFSYSHEKGNMSSDDNVSQISNLIKPHHSSKDRHHIETYAPKVSRASNWSLYTTSTMGSMLNIAHVIEPQIAPDPSKLKTGFWVKDLIDIYLLKNYLAMMIAFNYILLNMGAFSIVYLPSYAKRMGVTSQNAAILLTITGSMDIIGRLSFGFLADLKIIRPHLIIVIISTVIGTVTHFMPLFTNFETLVMYSVAHGLLGGVGINLTTVLTVDILGIQHLGKMLAMSSMFNSLSFFIQHPIQGALIEATGGFTTTYHYVGTCFLLSACLLLTEPLLRKLQAAKEKAQDSKEKLALA